MRIEAKITISRKMLTAPDCNTKDDVPKVAILIDGKNVFVAKITDLEELVIDAGEF